jgi:hypothetical protein
MGWSLRPGSNGLPAVYKTAALPGELRRHRAAVRCRPGPPALRRRDRSRARRRSFRGWARTSESRGQGPAGDNQRPTRNWYGRRDSNSHAAGSEPTRYASSHHARKVRRQGLEPRFPGLRVQCCTRIARGARSGMQESNRSLSSGQEDSNLRSHAPKACALPLGHGQPVDLKGLEPLCRLRAKQMLTQLSYRPAVEASPAGPSP